MAGNKKVILDAGHGGDEPGAIYNGRKEKDDTLRLTLAVGMQCRFRGQEGELPFWYMKILGLQQFWRKIF